MRLITPTNLTANSPIGTLALRRQSSIAALLLIMTETQPLGDLRLVAVTNATLLSASRILALGRQSPMTADLLIVTRAVTRGARLAMTVGRST